MGYMQALGFCCSGWNRAPGFCWRTIKKNRAQAYHHVKIALAVLFVHLCLKLIEFRAKENTVHIANKYGWE
jgi:hypothetical protein